MSFFDRAKNLYNRGEAVRAAVLLAEGLKRNPGEADALEWLLDLYVRELPTSGIESELIQILANQPNGRVLYEVVENALETSGAYDKLKALDDCRRRAGVLPEVDDSQPAASPAAPQSAGPTAASDVPPGADGPGRPDADPPSDSAKASNDDWSALDPQSMATPSSSGNSTSGVTAPTGSSPRAHFAEPESESAAGFASEEPQSGLSRVLPPLDDVSDDLIGLGIGEDEPDVASRGLLSYVSPFTIAVAVALILLATAFVVAFNSGSNASGADAGGPEREGSTMEDM
jgi:hypothetical protein